MDHVDIDVHKRESQICILCGDGELIERRIRTEAAHFADARPATARAGRSRSRRVGSERPRGPSQTAQRRPAAWWRPCSGSRNAPARG
jgi:hypothetical protein